MPPRIPPDQVSPAMNDLPNFDPIAVADEIAALETEAQDKLAEAEDEFKSDRSYFDASWAPAPVPAMHSAANAIAPIELR